MIASRKTMRFAMTSAVFKIVDFAAFAVTRAKDTRQDRSAGYTNCRELLNAYVSRRHPQFAQASALDKGWNNFSCCTSLDGHQ